MAPAGDLHGSWPSVERDPSVRAVARCRPTGSAVVLGSTQPDGMIDVASAEAAGLAVVRRRSGGGAVLVTPDDPVWIDAWVPAGDALWSDDVTRAFAWLGRVWADALADLGLAGVTVQGDGPGARTRWSSLVCFGGVGAGEVSVDGRKVVGLAQRRTGHGAWFHGACVLAWEPGRLVDTLVLDGDDRSAVTAVLAGAVTGTDAAAAQGRVPAPTAEVVASAFVNRLP